MSRQIQHNCNSQRRRRRTPLIIYSRFRYATSAKTGADSSSVRSPRTSATLPLMVLINLRKLWLAAAAAASEAIARCVGSATE